MKWLALIYTRRGLEAQIRASSYLQVRTDEIRIWNITIIHYVEISIYRDTNISIQ